MNQTNNKEPPESAVKVQSAPCEDSRGTELQTIPESRYAPPYTAHDGNLCRAIASKSGIVYLRLCNFVPYLLCEMTVDDGTEITRKYRIGGYDENGEMLPPVDVPATELEKMEWMVNRWGARCDIDIVPHVREHIRAAIKSTARYAEHKYIFAHTGWQKINGRWQFLLPGNGECEVILHGKQRNYSTSYGCTPLDLSCLTGMLTHDLAPCEVIYPCLALVFLSPLNEFLHEVGHEPKFLLTLIGRTGSKKSTLAALMLSFFGNFSATDLPMSFRDTANSIVHNAFALKDVLTCIDDYHPTTRREGEGMKSIMQTLARSYGDRAARNRLTSDITLREPFPPRGNAIVTAEFAPDIGESGTARMFCIEMKPDDISLPHLSEMQEHVANGGLMRCMSSYLDWLRESFLTDGEREDAFLLELKSLYESLRTCWRERLQKNKIIFHDRLSDTLACLAVGFLFLLKFLCAKGMIGSEDGAKFEKRFDDALLSLSAQQSKAVESDRPTHIFLSKLVALLECGQLCVVPSDTSVELPHNCIGYEDNEYYYLFLDMTHKSVKRLCAEQDECFSLSSKALAKSLAEEGYIESGGGENTRAMRFCGKQKRVMLLRKSAVGKVQG